jgi:DNA-binding Xre family transcriptional regulator
MVIKSKVQGFMEAQDLTVRKFAEMTGLSLQTIMRARDARIGTCTLNTLTVLASALGVRVKDLFEEG